MITNLATWLLCFGGPGKLVEECKPHEQAPLLQICLVHSECLGFDMDADGDVDLFEWAMMLEILSTPVAGPPPLPPVCIYRR